jgi:acylphosphatase
MSRACRVRVTGQVQGVFFRAWTCEQAQQLHVAGWVRNCADGSVEAHLEGEDSAVEQLTGLMRGGPPGARVEQVEVSESEAERLDSFELRH